MKTSTASISSIRAREHSRRASAWRRSLRMRRMQLAEFGMLLVFWIIAMAIAAEVKTSSGGLPRMLWPMLGLVAMMLTVMLFELVKRRNTVAHRQSRANLGGGISSPMT